MFKQGSILGSRCNTAGIFSFYDRIHGKEGDNKSVRSEVGETLSHRVFAVTEYATSEEYTAICRALITKYPILADLCGRPSPSYNFECFRMRLIKTHTERGRPETKATHNTQ